MEWIKCSERLPEIDQRMLVYDSSDDLYRIGFFKKDLGVIIFYLGLLRSTLVKPKESSCFWMPLPQPPKQ